MKKKLLLSDKTKHFPRFVPNLLTICNSLCGFAAILYTLQVYRSDPEDVLGVFCVSAIMIFSAMIFDAFDGLAARALNAASVHGIQMDSLSDMVTFGVAPAVVVVVMTDSLRDGVMGPLQIAAVYLLCSVYIGCAALRLATYNVHAMSAEKKGDPAWFSGMPSPGAAAAICVAVFFAHDTALPVEKFAFVLPVYTAILGLLMVSRIPYIHAGRWLFSVRKSRKKMLILAILIVIAAAFRTSGIAAIVTAYVLSGPLTGLFGIIRSKNL
ncbi:MAG: CDP-alcohol phosphatidyltransferase family protein [Lentisphaeria bacterium]|nr:CDP-alcohol phosphatidyltransferase family protein [Lentisphaeria bacterium]